MQKGDIERAYLHCVVLSSSVLPTMGEILVAFERRRIGEAWDEARSR